AQSTSTKVPPVASTSAATTGYPDLGSFPSSIDRTDKHAATVTICNRENAPRLLHRCFASVVDRSFSFTQESAGSPRSNRLDFRNYGKRDQLRRPSADVEPDRRIESFQIFRCHTEFFRFEFIQDPFGPLLWSESSYIECARP